MATSDFILKVKWFKNTPANDDNVLNKNIDKKNCIKVKQNKSNSFSNLKATY